jgi:hypothetical protein
VISWTASLLIFPVSQTMASTSSAWRAAIASFHRARWAARSARVSRAQAGAAAAAASHARATALSSTAVVNTTAPSAAGLCEVSGAPVGAVKAPPMKLPSAFTGASYPGPEGWSRDPPSRPNRSEILVGPEPSRPP